MISIKETSIESNSSESEQGCNMSTLAKVPIKEKRYFCNKIIMQIFAVKKGLNSHQ